MMISVSNERFMSISFEMKFSPVLELFVGLLKVMNKHSLIVIFCYFIFRPG